MRSVLFTSVALAALALASAASAQTSMPNSGRFCLQSAGVPTGNCSFESMAQCEASKSGVDDQCLPNPNATTGSGSGMGTSPATPMDRPGQPERRQ